MSIVLPVLFASLLTIIQEVAMCRIIKNTFFILLAILSTDSFADTIEEVIVFNKTPKQLWFYSSLASLGTIVPAHSSRVMYFSQQENTTYNLDLFIDKNVDLECSAHLNYKMNPPKLDVTITKPNSVYTCKNGGVVLGYQSILVTGK